MSDLSDSTYANPQDFAEPEPMPLDEAWRRIYDVVTSCSTNGSDMEALDVIDSYLEEHAP